MEVVKVWLIYTKGLADLNHFTHFHGFADLLNISNTNINKYILSAKTASGVEAAMLDFQLDFPPYSTQAANS